MSIFILRFRDNEGCIPKYYKQILLKELHNPKITDKTFIFDAAKSSFGCQGSKFLSSPFLPSWVLSHHKHIDLRGALCRTANIWCNWKNCFQNYYLSIMWNSVVAVFQQFQAMFIIPIMKYPLQN